MPRNLPPRNPAPGRMPQGDAGRPSQPAGRPSQPAGQQPAGQTRQLGADQGAEQPRGNQSAAELAGYGAAAQSGPVPHTIVEEVLDQLYEDLKSYPRVQAVLTWFRDLYDRLPDTAPEDDSESH